MGGLINSNLDKKIFKAQEHAGFLLVFLSALFAVMLAWTAVAQASGTSIVEWNFPNNPDDAVADAGIAANSAKAITAEGGVNAPTFNITGASTYSARATGWDSGMDVKYWQIQFDASGYQTITFSSKQRSSNTGPRDFKVQYKVGDGGTWTDIAGAGVTLADDFTSGVLTDIGLPSECDNQPSIYVRWIMTSDIAVGTSTVGSTGASRIDDITVLGQEIPPPTPQCNDGVDNDSDGFTDIADPDCLSTADNNESDDTPPAVSVIAPATNSTLSGTINVQASSSDISSGINNVAFYYATNNNAPETYALIATVSTTVSTDTYAVDWDSLAVGNDTYYFVAVATDNAGNTATSSEEIMINLVNNTEPPVLAEVQAINSPTNDNTPEYIFNMNDTLDDFGVITYYGLCQATTTAYNGNNTIIFNAMADGTYDDCSFTVTDGAGNVSAPLYITPFTIDTSAPELSFASPSSNVVSSTVSLAITTADFSEVAKVEYYLDEAKIGEGIENPFSFDWDSNSVADGAYDLRAILTDMLGNQKESDPMLINIDNTLEDGVLLQSYFASALNFDSSVSGGTANLYIPAGATASSNIVWDNAYGSAITLDDSEVGQALTIELGSPADQFMFNKAIRIKLPIIGGYDSSKVYTVKYRAPQGVPQIISQCPVNYTVSDAATAALSPSGQCYFIDTAAGKIVIWTMHLTRFGYSVSAVSSNSGSGGGISIIYSQFTMPASGFSILINQGATTTNKRVVTITLNGGPDAANVAFSNSSDFSLSYLEPYQSEKTWQLSQADGIKYVYAKFYNKYGYASAAVSSSIELKTGLIASTTAISPIKPQVLGVKIYNFKKNLYYGTRNPDIKNLQRLLINSNSGKAAKILARVGATGYFGHLTRAALAEYQRKFNIRTNYGYFGPVTRKYVNSLSSQ